MTVPPVRSQRSLTTLTTGLLLAAVLPQYLAASLVVEMREDFPLSDAQLGIAVAVSFALSAVISPLAGRVVDWIGIGRGVWISAALVVVSSAAMATVADSAGAVILLMAVNGLGGGIGSPALSALLVGGIRSDRHGTAFGLFTSAPQIAAFGAGLALPLVASPFGWRLAFWVPVLIGVACVVALVRSGPLPARRPGPVRVVRLPGPRRQLRSIHAIAVSAALASAAGIGMRSFLVVFAVSVGFSSTVAGLLLSASGLLAIISRVGFGILGDRRPGDSLLRTAGLMFLCAIGFVLMAAGGQPLIVLGALIAGGIGWGWQSPLSLAVVTQYRDATAVAVGIQMSGFFAGAVVGPLAVGLLAQGGGYTTAWMLAAGLALAAAAAALLARRLAAADRAAAGPL